MTALLALITVVAWGTWIPMAQAARGVPQRLRTFYVTVGNFAFATVALVSSGGHLSSGWREFWLPLVGGLVWTAGNYSAFRATEAIGLARAAGSWTPLNVITACSSLSGCCSLCVRKMLLAPPRLSSRWQDRRCRLQRPATHIDAACSGPLQQDCCGVAILCQLSGQRCRRRWLTFPSRSASSLPGSFSRCLQANHSD